MTTPKVLQPYDAIVLLSFGGPEGPDDVMPFLRNVTSGRGIPDARLAEVAEHYHHFGGRSPINDQNRALISALRAELSARGEDVPLLWGNRNWHPFLTDALREAHAAGYRRLLVLTTSAYSSYSSCRQYRENLAASLAELGPLGAQLQVDKVRPYFNAPGFAQASVQGIRAALEGVSAPAQNIRVAFVTHSIPTAMNDAAGPQGGAYERQHREVCQAVMSELGTELEWDLVYCSRSGPPTQPWLEPDIGDHLSELAGQGVTDVVCVPIGFISDHLEVIFDLDTEAAQIAKDLGVGFHRVPTAGLDPAFVSSLVDLLFERAAVAQGLTPQVTTTVPGPYPPPICPVGCCANARAALPTACGEPE